MISRVLLGVFLAFLMVISGSATYIYIGAHQSKVGAAPLKPTEVKPVPRAFTLPGTLYISQSGAIYSLSVGRFHELTHGDGWMQPSLTPDGNLLVIRRFGFYSDVYELSPFGRVMRQLTNNQAPRYSYDTADNHWAFYPRLTSDGRTIVMSYDDPKWGYEVDLSIWAIPFGGSVRQGTNWSDTYADPGYTGGDLQPIPVRRGIVYTRYDRAYDGSIISQLWYTDYPGTYGHALTAPGQDCREPSFSPDGGYVAMICTYGKQISNLVIAPWYGSSLGPLTTVIGDQMVAQPTWAPDGSGIAYLAPALPDEPFQLWFVPRARYFPPAPSPVPTPTPIPGGPQATPVPTAAASPVPTPPPPPPVNPIQLTSSLAFDASSTLAWAP